MIFVSKQQALQRYDICLACDEFRPLKTCAICHCFMPFKVRVASCACPKEKWLAIDASEPDEYFIDEEL